MYSRVASCQLIRTGYSSGICNAGNENFISRRICTLEIPSGTPHTWDSTQGGEWWLVGRGLARLGNRTLGSLFGLLLSQGTSVDRVRYDELSFSGYTVIVLRPVRVSRYRVNPYDSVPDWIQQVLTPS